MMEEKKINLAGDLRLYVLLLFSTVILLFILWDEESALGDLRMENKNLEARLRRARKTVKENKQLLLPPLARVLNPYLLHEKSLLTLVKEATDKIGIPSSLEAVNPLVDRKSGALKAKVSLRNVTLRKIVAFLLHMKNLEVGIEDREAVLRMIGFNQDRWRLEVNLSAPPGIPRPKRPKKTKERASAVKKS